MTIAPEPLLIPDVPTEQSPRDSRRAAKMRQLIVGFEYDPPVGWQKDARCGGGADPQVFQLVDASKAKDSSSIADVNRERHESARWYCERCPVVAQCLGYALTHELQGTWGGEMLTADDWKTGRQVRKTLEGK